MRHAMLVLVLLVAAAGCGTDSKQPFFKPELSGAVYAAPAPVGDPTSDDAGAVSKVAKLQLNSSCYFTPFGWTCSGDTFDDNGLWTMSDQAGGYYCAPKFKPIAAP